MKGSKWLRPLVGLCIVTLTLPFAFTPADARVTRIEILERGPFAVTAEEPGGMSFGDVGPYERIKGRLYYAVNPDNRFNRQIVDLQLAKTGQLRRDVSVVHTTTPGYVEEVVGEDARNVKGEVEFWGDFLLLKPVDMSKGNHRLLYDVNNRGNLRMLEYYNDAVSTNNPTTPAHAGNGWLMREGYTLLWTGWNWDVESPSATNPPQRIFLPIIVNPDGSPLVELINAELTVQTKDGIGVEYLAWGNSRCYSVADDTAVMTARDDVDVDRGHLAPRETIPREAWKFVKLGSGRTIVTDPALAANAVQYPFKKGKIYEVLYHAKNPRVVGLGLAGIRDAMSFFHYETQDDYGTLNPLAVPRGKARRMKADPEYAYIFGISQSGRVITTMIYQGFHVDEKGRMVFEGARPDVPGGGKGAFNYRWAQTTHHPKHIEANYFPADHFPFNFTEDGEYQIDPYRWRLGMFGDVLAVAKRLRQIPKIMMTNHETEYWTRAASLVHTDVFGRIDKGHDSHRFVRFYAINGSQHGSPSASSRRTVANDWHSDGFVEHRPVGRALLRALDRWVAHGTPPPATKVPKIRNGELVTVEKHAADFPKIPAYVYNGVTFPAVYHPAANLKPPRADYGPHFFMPMPWPWDEVPVAYSGYQDAQHVPPTYFGPPYETRVPYFDEDGNGIGGIRMVELEVPLGTYQGWNPRCPSCGATNYLQPFNVSFWPFAATRAERLENGDPRLSIEERYTGLSDYVAKVARAAAKLRAKGFILEEDEAAMVEKAGKLVWPPVPTEEYPFWKMNP
jgi:hypothetical protein